jgi:hypothetical protein
VSLARLALLGGGLVLILSGTGFAAAPSHLIVGFSLETSEDVVNAAALGVTTTIRYDAPPDVTSPLGQALSANHITVIDARFSDELFYWECHRTHTVAPPTQGRNRYCPRDEHPQVDSEQVVLADIDGFLAEDAANPLVVGYWVLDDWAHWDDGSAHQLLQDVHAHIAQATPGYPAVCGFGTSVLPAGMNGWDPGLALNYSNAGCDMVGWYLYADSVHNRHDDGSGLDWSMSSVLPAMAQSLAQQGWVLSATPLLGIGQAWSGRIAGGYRPGLNSAEMVTQAQAFCAAGATSIAWYAWHDSEFRHRTNTPSNAPAIDAGITGGISACEQLWQ